MFVGFFLKLRIFSFLCLAFCENWGVDISPLFFSEPNRLSVRGRIVGFEIGLLMLACRMEEIYGFVLCCDDILVLLFFWNKLIIIF